MLAPKVSGAWNLHAQTAGPAARFLRHVLVAVERLRPRGTGQLRGGECLPRRPGLASPRRWACPRLTVNWGYLGEVGYLAQRAELGERLERQGVLSFTVRAGAGRCWRRPSQRQHVQVSVMRVDWSRWRGLGVTGRVSPRFAHLCGHDDAGRVAAGNGTLPGATPSWRPIRRRRPGLLEALLRDKVARVLGTAPDRLDGDKPLLSSASTR